MRLTGKPDAACRSLLGRLLRMAGDDCALLASVLHEAEAQRVMDPVPWITAAVETRTGSRGGSGARPFLSDFQRECIGAPANGAELPLGFNIAMPETRQ